MGRITAGRGYDYLTRDVATSKHDYYTGRGEALGVWTGRGAVLLGLRGEVDAADMAVLYGRFVVPSTAGGVRLPSGRWEHEQVLGRKVVVTAHESAVAAALAYLDQTAGHTRAGDGGVRKIASNGSVIAQFRHRSARSTDPASRVGDPQLHSLCAILNRVRGADGTWRTLDSRAIYRHAHAAGAVYSALLEQELSDRLGVSWTTPDRTTTTSPRRSSTPAAVQERELPLSRQA